MNTEPGSYTWVSAELDGASVTPAGSVLAAPWAEAPLEPAVVAATVWPAAAPAGGDGVVACRLAMARMSPVFTSMTTALPPSACDATISAPRACSATYWIDWSRVSSNPVPGWAAFPWRWRRAR